MPEPKEEDSPEDDVPKFAIVGRPNAGKSSLINAFIGEERHIVTDIAGTTRDSIYHRYDKFGFDFYLVDTAGIRKKQKVNEDIEYYSVIRSIRAIEASDVCILMIDATRGIEAQDANIFSLVQRNKKGLVVCVNKWDIAEDRSLEAQKRFEQAIRGKFAPFTDFPIIFTSAVTKQRIYKVLETAISVYKEPPPHHPHLAAQHLHARADSPDAAAEQQGQVREDKIRYDAQGIGHPDVRLLLQPPAMGQGAVPPLPGEQDTRALGLPRHARLHLHARQVMTEGCSFKDIVGRIFATPQNRDSFVPVCLCRYGQKD